MGWASLHIEKLRRGETVSFRPVGNSMTPRIRSRQLVTVAPVETADVALGDVVLCNVNGNQMLHLVSAIDVTRERFQISNNHGHVNGWTAARQIHGKVIALEP